MLRTTFNAESSKVADIGSSVSRRQDGGQLETGSRVRVSDMPRSIHATDRSLNLRVGEWVEVRSATAILATLDDSQCVDGLPFMPEMLQYCGKRFRVLWSAHKTADTIELDPIRRMANAVHLEELRCNGAAHGGCQAECLLFWSESWLKRLPVEAIRPEISSNATVEDGCAPQNVSSLSRGTRRQVADGKAERYRCQATEMLNASSEVRRRDRWDPRFYLKDVTSGNVTLINFILFGALAMLNAFLKQWFGVRYSGIRGLVVGKTPTLTLNLQPGELVECTAQRRHRAHPGRPASKPRNVVRRR